MSSSIFSSENLRAYRRLPGAEKRRQLMVVLLLAALLVAGHGLAAWVDEVLVPYTPLARSVRAREALSESTEVIFAGSSHVLLGIRPDLLSVEAVNIAGPGWDYRTLEAAVRANLERVPNLKLAVIELDPLPMRIDTPTVQRGHCEALRVWGISPQEVPCRDLLVEEGALGELARWLVPLPRLTPYSIWERVERRLVGPEGSRTPVREEGFLSVGEGSKHGPSRVRWIERRFMRKHTRRNRAALGRLTGMLLQHDVKVVLLRMPHHASFTDNLPPKWVRELELAARRMRFNMEARIPIWDYEQRGDFSEGDFMDSVHLNAVGAKKLSARLDAMIRRELER